MPCGKLELKEISPFLRLEILLNMISKDIFPLHLFFSYRNTTLDFFIDI